MCSVVSLAEGGWQENEEIQNKLDDAQLATYPSLLLGYLFLFVSQHIKHAYSVARLSYLYVTKNLINHKGLGASTM